MGTERDDRLRKTHDFETMSEMTVYRNHIKNLEIETREVFERKTSSPENIQRTLPMNIVTQLDNNQLTLSTDSSKHEEMHEPEVNPDPEPSSSDSSDTSSLDSRAKKNKSTKKKSVVSIGKMTRQTHLRATTLIIPMSVITDAIDTKIRNTGNWIQSNYAQL